VGLEELLSALRTEAAEEAARIETESRREAERILAEARAEARRLEEEPARAQEAALEAEAGRRLALARLDAARAVREARERAFADALAALREALAGLREEARYPDVLPELVREACGGLPGGRELRVDPRDRSLAEEAARGLGAKVEVFPALATWGGVELASDDGRLLRNTLEERLANAEPSLRLLFAELAGRA
jgi:vacuolar-type H+-ATPase subunit E/Vma4